jgi:Holliday junction resolvase RusA-like endonuclease
MIHFTVHGTPRPAGSKQSFPVINRATGDPVRAKATGRIITRTKHDNPATKDWMDKVANIAREHYDGTLLEGPLRLALLFKRTRPRSHYGTGRNAGKLKASAPEYPTTRPDTVKLTRAIEDALTKVIWRDDSQVVDHHLLKRYGDSDCVEVTIEALAPAEPEGEADEP